MDPVVLGSIDEYGHPRLYQNATTANRTKARLYQNATIANRTKARLYQNATTAKRTKARLYQNATSNRTKARLYQNATASNRTKAKVSNGSSVDLEWQLYQDISDHESLMCSECLSAMGQVVISWYFTWGLWHTGFIGTFSEATSVSRHGFSCDQRACIHSTKWICFSIRCDISEESD